MANTWDNKLGQSTTAKAPTSIMNQEHDDKSLSARSSVGSPGTPGSILASSTADTNVVPNYIVLRVVNTTSSVQYLYIGNLAGKPSGAPSITTGLAIPPNSRENFFLGKLANDNQSIYVKSSDAGVQVVVMEQ